jgi:hypothetical protein
MPGKSWNTILRLHNPLESFFDKSWRGRRIRKDRPTIQMACQIPSPVGMRNPYATHILLRLPAQPKSGHFRVRSIARTAQ